LHVYVRVHGKYFMMSSVFLSAEWRKLALVNYEVDPALLQSYLPHKTELDLWNSTCYVSLVGFMFLNTKLKGIKIPFHSDFEEVNLRFYVRHHDANTKEGKRGVVFIKEIVPKPALTFVANTIYKENYETMPMKHSWIEKDKELIAEYLWKSKRWNTLRIIADANAVSIGESSEEEFITEHYWGYTKISESKSSEYQVEHPHWNVYPVRNTFVDVDFEEVYDERFKILNRQKPKSVFLAEGSPIAVRSGRLI
jgi:uncharacterized protein YqjF (DUF2071 family)